MANDIAMNVERSDLIIKDGDLLVIDNAERVSQQILITLREWLGEWFLNISNGVPYTEYILVKNPNLAHIRQILIDKIMSVEGVINVDYLDVKFLRAKRSLEIEYEAVTTYGLITGRELLGYGK